MTDRTCATCKHWHYGKTITPDLPPWAEAECRWWVGSGGEYPRTRASLSACSHYEERGSGGGGSMSPLLPSPPFQYRGMKLIDLGVKRQPPLPPIQAEGEFGGATMEGVISEGPVS